MKSSDWQSLPCTNEFVSRVKKNLYPVSAPSNPTSGSRGPLKASTSSIQLVRSSLWLLSCIILRAVACTAQKARLSRQYKVWFGTRFGSVRVRKLWKLGGEGCLPLYISGGRAYEGGWVEVEGGGLLRCCYAENEGVATLKAGGKLFRQVRIRLSLMSYFIFSPRASTAIINPISLLFPMQGPSSL